MPARPSAQQPSLGQVARDWGRIGITGFGGPPAHIALLRALCVTRRQWLTEDQFQRAIAATNMLPGPASTQLAIYCAWRLRGVRGALVGGLGFIVPGLIAIVALAALFLQGSPPVWVRGAAMGAGAVVAAVAVRAASGLAAPIWRARRGGERAVAVLYAVAGACAAAIVGPWLLVALLGAGAIEVGRRSLRGNPGALHVWPLPGWLLLGASAAPAGIAALGWTALKVGALSFGGGFVIVPLMQADAVSVYHWMTHAQFLSAVALGQITPGPVVLTVAVVGYAAAGVPGALLAATVAFAPSFLIVSAGAGRFERVAGDARVSAFLGGAGPAAAGAIAGSAVPLALALSQPWQAGLLALGAVVLLVLRRGVVITLLAAGAAGGVGALAGLSVGS